jgi:hypothetical protein
MLNNETIILLFILVLGIYSVYYNKPEKFTSGGVFQQLYAKDSQDDFLTSNHTHVKCGHCGH